jgi:hypothetical protein
MKSAAPADKRALAPCHSRAFPLVSPESRSRSKPEYKRVDPSLYPALPHVHENFTPVQWLRVVAWG